jgi:hypothetical protein
MATERGDGRSRLDQLPRQAFLAGWPTPNAGPQNDTDSRWLDRRAAIKAKGINGNGFGLTLGMAATLAGWPTPTAEDHRRGCETAEAAGHRAPAFPGGRIGRPGPVNGRWSAADWILCRDPDGPRWRPVEPGSFPLADGPSARVVRLRGYGNAINAEVAAGFIRAAVEAFGLESLE